jgi:hypothetical protein
MSTPTYNVIDKLPYELRDRLAADDFFAAIPVVVADKGNVKAQIAAKQAVVTSRVGKRGVAVVVLQIVADDPTNELATGPLLLRAAFQVVENVELNNDANPPPPD